MPFTVRATSVLAVVLVVVVGCDPTVDPGPSESLIGGTVAGVVSIEGVPAEAIGVTLDGPDLHWEQLTEVDGTYVFHDLEDGTYTVMVAGYPSDIAFDPASYEVTPAPGDTTIKNFDGTYIRTASITGTVVAGSRGLEGVTVTLVGPDTLETTTDADGRYAFAELRAGTYTVTITGYPEDVTFETTQHEVTVDVGENGHQDFAGIPPEPTVIITAVEDVDGAAVSPPGPVAGSIVLWLNADPSAWDATALALIVDGVEAAREEKAFTEGLETFLGLGTHRPEDTDFFNEPLHQAIALDGTAFFGEFPNGSHEVTARMVFADRDPVDSPPVTLDFDNDNIVIIHPMIDAVDVGGAPFFGGQDVPVSATPVVYDNSQVGVISIEATAGTQTPGGSGILVLDQTTDDAPPFIFTIPFTENAGGAEDALGDGPDGQGGAGSDICLVSVLDTEGNDVTGSFSGQCGSDIFFDFGPPALLDPDILIDGDWIMQGYYSGSPGDEVNVFGLGGATDGGVGVEPPELGGGAVFDIVDETGAVLFSDVYSTGELPENPLGGTKMFVWCRDVVDLVGNRIPASDMPQCQSPVEIAIDRSPPILSGPNGETFTGSFVNFQARDAELGGTLDPPAPGAGVMDYACSYNCMGVNATVLSGPAGAPEGLTCRSNPEYLSGTYAGTVGWSSSGDPGGHDPNIFDVPDTWPYTLDITLTVTLEQDGSLTITGAAPWVDVSGTLGSGTYPDEFVATGTGTVAGVENVGVELDARLIFQEGLIFGSYTMGTGGELPGGESIEYSIEVVFDGDLEAARDEFIMVIPAAAPDGSYTVEIETGDWAFPPNMVTEEFTFTVNRSS
jgi:hypothetical protein